MSGLVGFLVIHGAGIYPCPSLHRFRPRPLRVGVWFCAVDLLHAMTNLERCGPSRVSSRTEENPGASAPAQYWQRNRQLTSLFMPARRLGAACRPQNISRSRLTLLGTDASLPLSANERWPRQPGSAASRRPACENGDQENRAQALSARQPKVNLATSLGFNAGCRNFLQVREVVGVVLLSDWRLLSALQNARYSRNSAYPTSTFYGGRKACRVASVSWKRKVLTRVLDKSS